MAFLTILYGFCGASEVVGDMGQSRKFNITGGVRQGRVLFRAVLPWAMIRVSTWRTDVSGFVHGIFRCVLCNRVWRAVLSWLRCLAIGSVCRIRKGEQSNRQGEEKPFQPWRPEVRQTWCCSMLTSNGLKFYDVGTHHHHFQQASKVFYMNRWILQYRSVSIVKCIFDCVRGILGILRWRTSRMYNWQFEDPDRHVWKLWNQLLAFRLARIVGWNGRNHVMNVLNKTFRLRSVSHMHPQGDHIRDGNKWAIGKCSQDRALWMELNDDFANFCSSRWCVGLTLPAFQGGLRSDMQSEARTTAVRELGRIRLHAIGCAFSRRRHRLISLHVNVCMSYKFESNRLCGYRSPVNPGCSSGRPVPSLMSFTMLILKLPRFISRVNPSSEPFVLAMRLKYGFLTSTPTVFGNAVMFCAGPSDAYNKHVTMFSLAPCGLDLNPAPDQRAPLWIRLYTVFAEQEKNQICMPVGSRCL